MVVAYAVRERHAANGAERGFNRAYVAGTLGTEKAGGPASDFRQYPSVGSPHERQRLGYNASIRKPTRLAMADKALARHLFRFFKAHNFEYGGDDVG